MGQNLKETLFLGNITWSEMWERKHTGCLRFYLGQSGFYYSDRMQRVSSCKKVEYF